MPRCPELLPTPPLAPARHCLDALITITRAFAPGYARVSITVDCGETVVSIEASAATGPDGMARLAAELGLPAPTPRSGARETWLESDLVDRQRQLIVSLTGCWAPIVGTVVL